jgi:hypothetical protein
MKSLEIFNRKSREWRATVSIKNGKFNIDGKDKEVVEKIGALIPKLISRGPRHVGAFQEGKKITEVFRNEAIEAKEENLPFLEKELSGWFPELRFVIHESSELKKDKERAKKIAKDATYLSAEQKEKILKMFEELGEKEIPLLIDDIFALERMFKSI